VPWKKRADPTGMPSADRTSESPPIRAQPLADKRAPAGSTLFAQPRPGAPELPHGHAAS
jgi:hypothetical protein